MKTVTVSQFCMAIQHLEGYFPPCAQYPEGSPAYRNHNPGNIKCDSVMNPLATGCNGPFCVFPDDATGFQALEHNMTNVIKGNSIEYGYFPSMTLVQFFKHRDPSSENDPVSCAINVASYLGVPTSFQLKDIIIN
jgi:hypothetical protein